MAIIKYDTENKTNVSLKAFATALNNDLYVYLCDGCKDGWDCDWDKLGTRLKQNTDIERYVKVKNLREALKILRVGILKVDFKATLVKILAGSFTLGVKLTMTKKLVRSSINRKPKRGDCFDYLKFAE